MEFQKVELRVNGVEKYATLTDERGNTIKVFRDGDVIHDARRLAEVRVQIKHSELRFHAVKGYQWTKVHRDGTFKYCYKDFNPQKGVLVPYFPPQNELEKWLESKHFGYSLKHVRYINDCELNIRTHEVSDAKDFLIINKDNNILFNMDKENHRLFVNTKHTWAFTLRRNSKKDIVVDSVVVARNASYNNLIHEMETALAEHTYESF